MVPCARRTPWGEAEPSPLTPAGRDQLSGTDVWGSQSPAGIAAYIIGEFRATASSGGRDAPAAVSRDNRAGSPASPRPPTPGA